MRKAPPTRQNKDLYCTAVKNCLVGGGISLLSYVLLQMLCALLVDRGVLGLDQIYPLVCITAAAASFLGCGYSVLKGKGTSMLSVPVVVVVFLSLTLAAALVTTDAVQIENGLTGLGLSMAAGGLLAALVGYNLPKGKRGRTGTRRKKRR